MQWREVRHEGEFIGIRMAEGKEVHGAIAKYVRHRYVAVLQGIFRHLKLLRSMSPDQNINVLKIISSFGQRVTQLDEMQQVVVLYATRAAEKLREQDTSTSNVLSGS
ncbi:hypothetical protein [Pantoea agglomerans]|uniref:hypothetical protein n=1 Tax=Enterobacter agglomerans TaxID=549 RepID=UPI0013C1197C|nr:hypothetical protein [Pantoea agglomerans]NEH20627.1 hypothetical protein [Pantoea agglomerans]